MVKVEPALDGRLDGGVHHRGVVGVAYRHQAAGPQHPPELPESADGVGQVLQHLVGIDHVEAAVVGGQLVGRADLEGDVGDPFGGREIAGRLHHVLRHVQADHPTGSPGQADGDRAGAAAHVEDGGVGSQPREQEGGGVLGGAPGVGPDDGRVVAVRVALAGGPVGSHCR